MIAKASMVPESLISKNGAIKKSTPLKAVTEPSFKIQNSEVIGGHANVGGNLISTYRKLNQLTSPVVKRMKKCQPSRF